MVSHYILTFIIRNCNNSHIIWSPFPCLKITSNPKLVPLSVLCTLILQVLRQYESKNRLIRVIQPFYFYKNHLDIMQYCMMYQSTEGWSTFFSLCQPLKNTWTKKKYHSKQTNKYTLGLGKKILHPPWKDRNGKSINITERNSRW